MTQIQFTGTREEFLAKSREMMSVCEAATRARSLAYLDALQTPHKAKTP